MYVNKGMSTIKIADKLNEKEILAPAIYLKIPTYINKKSANSKGEYIWLRSQINNILRNEVYIGNVVGRKYRKVSHKIAKVRKTKKEDYVVVENMHEPIIDVYTWNKAQEKLNDKNATRERRYDHPLKGLIFCKECGKIATLRCRTEERKSGKIWRADYFICSNRNSYRSLCECKQIQAKAIEDEIKRVLNNEIKKITYSSQELKQIYKDAQIELEKEKYKLEKDLSNYKRKLSLSNRILEELYEDKVNQVIRKEDFERLYKQTAEEQKETIKKIKELEVEIKEIEEKLNDLDMEKIEERAKEILSLDNITKEMYQKLIERIEFDKEKNIFIRFKFAKYTEK